MTPAIGAILLRQTIIMPIMGISAAPPTLTPIAMGPAHNEYTYDYSYDGLSRLTGAYNAGGQWILKESSGGSWQFYVKDGPQTLAASTKAGSRIST